jgi:hypothetical protein
LTALTHADPLMLTLWPCWPIRTSLNTNS